MMSRFDRAASRRSFLQFLASSPLLAGGGFAAFAGEGPSPTTKSPDPLIWAPLDPDQLIKSPKEAINVFDFEPVCRNNVPPAHFGYMASCQSRRLPQIPAAPAPPQRCVQGRQQDRGLWREL
jgi:4-hydroxymandelate oxidase